MALWFELSFLWKASLICLKQTYKKALQPAISSKIISVVKSNLLLYTQKRRKNTDCFIKNVNNICQYSTLVHAGMLGLIGGFTVHFQKLAALVSGKQQKS